MKLDAAGIKLIQDSEELRLNAYLDIAGVPTIGYGTTIYPNGFKVKIGDKCTGELAEFYFFSDVSKFEKLVSFSITQPLTQHQFNALVSFCYNIGMQGFKDSRVRKLINAGNKDNKIAISAAFLAWNKIRKDGKLKVSEGLSNRRKREIDLYFTTP